MNNKYIYAAVVAIAFVVLSYCYHFYYVLNCNISDKTDVWGQFGDYAGGLLNPILSFITLILLIKSLNLQNEANTALKEDLRNNEKTEKLKMFETQFFNMLNAQSKAFDSFKIEIKQNGNIVVKKGIEAIIEIEEDVASIRQSQGSDNDIAQFLDNIDTNDQIYSSVRRFYIMVKMISDKLSNMNDFSEIERKSHFLTLINFTDFSLLRLLMMSIQFINIPITEYLKENEEFNSALHEVGINWNLY